MLDLAALPLLEGGTLNLIPLLNQHGFLDVLTGDDSQTDYYTLEVTTALIIPTLSPAGLAVLGLGLAAAMLLSVVRRRRHS